MSHSSDIKVQFISDEVAADDNFIVTAARPNTAATIANASFASGGARILSVKTAGTGDNAKTNTIVGTDVFDNALTEVITSTGSAEAVDGTKYFKTVTSVTSSAQFAANIEVGSIASAAQAVFGGPVRLKGFSIVSGGTAGVIEFVDGTPESGTVLFKARTVGTDNTTLDRTIPADGVLFSSGLSIKYTVGTIDMMTFFYA
jgi:hypothetical protein|tara:strand:+ start:30 stop:632 length:603 start_codon:yes stop_codon:yes gene_type:complete